MSEGQNRVPDVPRDTTKSPSATAPTPSALAMLSPLPGATVTPARSPSAAAASARSSPIDSFGATRSGKAPEREGRTRRIAAASCVRASTSKTPVPLASPHCKHRFLLHHVVHDMPLLDDAGGGDSYVNAGG